MLVLIPIPGARFYFTRHIIGPDRRAPPPAHRQVCFFLPVTESLPLTSRRQNSLLIAGNYASAAIHALASVGHPFRHRRRPAARSASFPAPPAPASPPPASTPAAPSGSARRRSVTGRFIAPLLSGIASGLLRALSALIPSFWRVRAWLVCSAGSRLHQAGSGHLRRVWTGSGRATGPGGFRAGFGRLGAGAASDPGIRPVAGIGQANWRNIASAALLRVRASGRSPPRRRSFARYAPLHSVSAFAGTPLLQAITAAASTAGFHVRIVIDIQAPLSAAGNGGASSVPHHTQL